jgi:serine/threonine-protein kinase
MSEITARLTTAIADRYRIERELGAGGMATVYLANDVKHERKVALKVLRPELAAVIGAERFLAEIKVTANLQHPHILPLHDSGEADTFLYYVMPFVEGETLRDKIEREKQLGITEAVEITRSVAAALDYAHRQNVIHRDIKPENILLHDGQALVADFGIALALSHAGGARLTETGLSIGTPHYMSPEQAMGDRELDARSDVYSLGAMLYEMLAGDPPYTGSTAQAIVAKVITEKAPSVTVHRDTVPHHVAASITKALAKLPADRFPTALSFAEALVRPGLADTDMHALPGEEEKAERAGIDRRLAAVAGVAVVAIALAAWGWLRPEAPRQVARFNVALPEGQGVASRFGPTVALSPDGSRIVYVGPNESGPPQLWLRPIDQLDGTPLPGTVNAFAPFFSPDGQSVAYNTGSPLALRVVSLAGGPPLTVVSDSVIPVGGDWGEDGMLYFARGGGSGLSRVPAGGGPHEVLTTVDTTTGENGHRWVDALPSGKGALFTIARGTNSEADIAVVSLETRETKVLLRGVMGRYVPTGHIVYTRADGALLAAPFDQHKLEITGPSTPLLEGIVVKAAAASEFALSNSGMLLYLAGIAASENLVWVERDGTERPVMSQIERDFEYVRVSPDGRRLVLNYETEAGQEDVWVYDLEQGTLSRLTFEGEINERPEWTPDGSRVTFVSTRRGQRELYWKPWDGSGPAELLLSSGRPLQEAWWSRDGEILVYREGPGGPTSRDIKYIRPGVDSVPTTFLATEFDEINPMLSPDGNWLVYSSNESGRREIYVRPFPQRGGRWQVSTDGGSEPLWMHSGDELVYRSLDDDLVSVEVRTEPTFSVGARRVLFDASEYERDMGGHVPYDITPDDQTFVFIKQEGGSRDVIVVLNWFEELLRRTDQ